MTRGRRNLAANTIALMRQIHIFDGHVARRHLEQRLAMRQRPPETEPAIAQEFERWQEEVQEAIRLHPRGPTFLVPPGWFA